MTIREQVEQMEVRSLSQYASLSINSKGRDYEEDSCSIRPLYQRDRDRILHSKSFRRLKDKTQVFLSPQGDHYRTRLTHTLEVSQTARTIAKALQLNEDLVEAIALGHDLGHTPFGHAGEYILNEICPEGFKHNEQSVRVVEMLEKKGEGLNLTWEVRDGILNHQSSGKPNTLEGKIVRLSDKISYINSDIDDAIRANILTEEKIPLEYREVLGFNSRVRLNALIHDIVQNSRGQADIIMSEEKLKAMNGLRAFMFANVYSNPIAKGEEEKAQRLLKGLYSYYTEHLKELPEEYLAMIDEKKQSKYKVICDYIAGMTDQYAIGMFQKLYMPNSWNV